MKLGTSGSAPAKPAAASVKTAMPSARVSARIAPRTAASSEERKRTQRVLLRVRANIHVAVKGQMATYEALTVSVHQQGALVVMKQGLAAETRLVLEHAGTNEKVACRVSRQAKEMPEGFHVPVEFDTPAPDFWKIAFPPEDWRPDDA